MDYVMSNYSLTPCSEIMKLKNDKEIVFHSLFCISRRNAKSNTITKLKT